MVWDAVVSVILSLSMSRESREAVWKSGSLFLGAGHLREREIYDVFLAHTQGSGRWDSAYFVKGMTSSTT